MFKGEVLCGLELKGRGRGREHDKRRGIYRCAKLGHKSHRNAELAGLIRGLGAVQFNATYRNNSLENLHCMICAVRFNGRTKAHL